MSYDWIKPGAKYRVVANNSYHQFRVGDAVWWTGEKDIFTNGCDRWHLWEEEVEFVKNDTLTVGKTYTSKNGCEWLCIAVDGDYAHMRHPDIPKDTAYVFTTDGTNISQGGGDWDVQFEPVRETIEVHGSFDRRHYDRDNDYITLHHGIGDHKFTMTIDIVDGKPEWSSAKLTGA